MTEVVGFAQTNGDRYTHAITGRKTVCGTFAVDTVAGPADCPDCLFKLQGSEEAEAHMTDALPKQATDRYRRSAMDDTGRHVGDRRDV